jgi:hypothetical protein
VTGAEYRRRTPTYEGFWTPEHLVWVAVIGDLLLGLIVILANLHVPGWVAFVVGPLILIIITVAFLRFAYFCWTGDPDPDGPSPALRITALLAMTVAIILGYTSLYWKATNLTGPQAFYGAVGTLSTASAPYFTDTETTGLTLLASQELLDLVFLSGFVAVMLGRIVNQSR